MQAILELFSFLWSENTAIFSKPCDLCCLNWKNFRVCSGGGFYTEKSLRPLEPFHSPGIHYLRGSFLFGPQTHNWVRLALFDKNTNNIIKRHQLCQSKFNIKIGSHEILVVCTPVINFVVRKYIFKTVLQFDALSFG